MDILPIDKGITFNKPSKNIEKIQEQTAGFGKVFEEKMLNVNQYVAPMDEAMKQSFRKKKDILEDGAEMVNEEEEESLHKTVDKMKKKLQALAELERRYYGF